MKKKFLMLFLACTTIGFSQIEKQKEINLGPKFQIGQIVFAGLELEYTPQNQEKYAYSFLFNAGFNGMRIKTDYGNAIGTGFELGVGERNYFKKDSSTDGFFVDAFLGYGSVYFDEKLNIEDGYFDFNGRYQYLTLLNPVIGYKFKFKKLNIEPSIGAKYNIEIKGKGSIDNRDIDNFLLSGGIKVSYNF